MLVDNIFVPTWLYIKQHNDTGLKYFGKTVRKDPIRYKGSGTYWNRHLEKHGDNVTTLWCQLFTDKNQLTEYALNFSKDNNIVESSYTEKNIQRCNNCKQDDNKCTCP